MALIVQYLFVQQMEKVSESQTSQAAMVECSMCGRPSPAQSDSLSAKANPVSCESGHKQLLCADCFLQTKVCPEQKCDKTFPTNRQLRKSLREVGLARTKQKILAVVAMTGITSQKFGSKEVKAKYFSKMYDLAEIIRKQYIEVLQNQINNIVNGHFMMESKQDEEDLAAIDQCLKEIKADAPYNETEFGKLMSGLNTYIQQRALKQLGSNPPIILLQSS